jgi:hypothetical protein
MTSLQLALGSLSLCLLQGCASVPATSGAGSMAANQPPECPPLFGKVCYGPSDRPDILRCGCSSVSPLGTPYP